MKRGRVLPDFSGVTVASTPLGHAVGVTSPLGGAAATGALGQEGKGEEGEGEQSGDDAALVGAIRATLASTIAQLDENKVTKAGVGVAVGGAVAAAQGGAADGRGGALPSRASGGVQQVWKLH